MVGDSNSAPRLVVKAEFHCVIKWLEDWPPQSTTRKGLYSPGTGPAKCCTAQIKIINVSYKGSRCDGFYLWPTHQVLNWSPLELKKTPDITAWAKEAQSIARGCNRHTCFVDQAPRGGSVSYSLVSYSITEEMETSRTYYLIWKVLSTQLQLTSVGVVRAQHVS